MVSAPERPTLDMKVLPHLEPTRIETTAEPSAQRGRPRVRPPTDDAISMGAVGPPPASAACAPSARKALFFLRASSSRLTPTLRPAWSRAVLHARKVRMRWRCSSVIKNLFSLTEWRPQYLRLYASGVSSAPRRVVSLPEGESSTSDRGKHPHQRSEPLSKPVGTILRASSGTSAVPGHHLLHQPSSSSLQPAAGM